MSSTMPREIRLQSGDGSIVVLDFECIKLSGVIKNMFEELASGDGPVDYSQTLVLPFVNGSTLEKIVEWLIHHKDTEFKEDIDEWDKGFIGENMADIVTLINAADYLDIKFLVKMTTGAVANVIRGRNVEQIREIFKIENDFTAEEEDQLRKENAWCEDDVP